MKIKIKIKTKIKKKRENYINFTSAFSLSKMFSASLQKKIAARISIRVPPIIANKLEKKNDTI